MSNEKLPTKTVCDDGWVEWKLNGKLHRLDGPAKISPDGQEFWYRNGKLHRDDGPAAVFPSGDKSWIQNGIYHRLDGPAVIFPDGRSMWYRNGHPPPIVHIPPNVLIFQDTFPIQDYPSLTKQDDGSYAVAKKI